MDKKTETQDKTSKNKSSIKQHYLILHNDKYNTYDYVKDTLVEVCNHHHLQAEQCVFITHHKGSCDIKKGERTKLEVLKTQLLNKGLMVTIN